MSSFRRCSTPKKRCCPARPVLHAYAPGNIVKHIPIRKGDVEAGFAEADLIIEESYQTQQVEHAYLEPEAGIAYVDHDDVVTVISPSQNITHHRHMLAKILAKPINKVRFIMSPVGGGFGGKEDMIYQGMLALAAMKTGRPVRLVYTREESIISTAKRHPARIAYKMGLKNDGRITAVAVQDDLRRRRLRHVHRGRDAQGGDPVLRPLQHPEREDRHDRRLHQQHARRAPSAPSARCRRSSPPNPISTSPPKSSASTRSKSAAAT